MSAYQSWANALGIANKLLADIANDPTTTHETKSKIMQYFIDNP